MPRTITPHPNALESSRTLVIGGTSGIGYAVASGALANGGSVYVASSSDTKLATAINDLKSLYPTASPGGTVADLSDTETIEANLTHLLDSAVEHLGGPLDHIVYTAGEPPSVRPLAEITAENAFSGWTVRYVGPLLVAKLVAAKPGVYLAASPKSSITLTSGVTTTRPRKGLSSLVAAPGALETLTRSLAMDLSPIRVNVVRLGVILTELVERAPEARRKEMAAKSLTATLGEPWEAAEAYLFSMRSSFTTGQDFVVDGGASYT